MVVFFLVVVKPQNIHITFTTTALDGTWVCSGAGRDGPSPGGCAGETKSRHGNSRGWRRRACLVVRRRTLAGGFVKKECGGGGGSAALLEEPPLCSTSCFPHWLLRARDTNKPPSRLCSPQVCPSPFRRWWEELRSRPRLDSTPPSSRPRCDAQVQWVCCCIILKLIILN